MLQGDCFLKHEGKSISADRILILVDGPVGKVRCRIAAEGVKNSQSDSVIWTTYTLVDPLVQAPHFRGSPDSPPDLLSRLIASTTLAAGASLGSTANPVQQVQYTQPNNVQPNLNSFPEMSLQPPTESLIGGNKFFVGGGNQSVEILPRSASSTFNLQTVDRPENGETIIAAQGGVTVLVRDVSASLTDGQMIELGTISLSADRIIFWSPR